MKKYKIILPLFIAFHFLGSSFIQKNKWSGIISHAGVLERLLI